MTATGVDAGYGSVAPGVYVFDDLFDGAELRRLDTFIDAALAGTVDSGPFSCLSSFRNGKVVDPDVAAIMGARVIPHLPATYTDAEGQAWAPKCAARVMMYAEVRPGQGFGIHTDTGCEHDGDAMQHVSRFTVLTYLTDGFDGGATEFFSDDWATVTASVTPRRNRTVVFCLSRYHKGAPVTALSPQGVAKRWVGTEIVCALRRRPQGRV